MNETIVLHLAQHTVLTTRSRARIRARHTQTCPQSSWADLMPKNSNGEKHPSLLTLHPYRFIELTPEREDRRQGPYQEAEDSPLARATCW